MCQITVANLHRDEYNKLFFLLAGSLGSTEHNHGWGFAQASAESSPETFKCSLPLYCTTNSGVFLRGEKPDWNDQPLIGHIRQASPQVPVTTDNAHPFAIENVMYVHNGKLTPRDEKEFIMEEDMDTWDEKLGAMVTKKVKRSDSLIFFEKFMDYFEKNTEEDLEKKFVECMNNAMSHFDGKFAMVFLIANRYFIVRGRSADLHIAYLQNEAQENIGWVINTNKKVLDWATILLSNTTQLLYEEALEFTTGKLLKEETIFVAEENDLRIIGTVKETYPVVSTYAGKGGATNFTGTSGGNGGTSHTKSSKRSAAEKYAETVYTFMREYSLTLADINVLFLIGYNCSLLDVDGEILKHFCNKVIPRLQNGTTKPLRKQMANTVTTFSPYRYSGTGLAYPWMLNSRTKQAQLIAEIAKQNAENKALQGR